MNNMKKFHPIMIIFISFSVLIPIMISTNLKIIIFYGILGIMYLFAFKLKFNYFLTLGILLIPITIPILILNVFNPDLAKIDTSNYFYLKNIKFINSVFYNFKLIKNFKIYYDALYNGLRLLARSYTLSLISIGTVILVDFYRLIFSLIQQFKLSLNFGYPAFIAINALKHAKNEYERILTIKKLRRIKGINIFSSFIPILVYSIRFAERSSIALLSRGYHNKKTFYFNYKLENKFLKYTIVISCINILLFIVYLFIL